MFKVIKIIKEQLRNRWYAKSVTFEYNNKIYCISELFTSERFYIKLCEKINDTNTVIDCTTGSMILFTNKAMPNFTKGFTNKDVNEETFLKAIKIVGLSFNADSILVKAMADIINIETLMPIIYKKFNTIKHNYIKAKNMSEYYRKCFENHSESKYIWDNDIEDDIPMTKEELIAHINASNHYFEINKTKLENLASKLSEICELAIDI